MEENKVILTEEEIDSVVETLEESKSNNANVLSNIIKEESPKEDMEAVEMQIAVDPVTGEETNLGFLQSIMEEHDITLDDIKNVDISDFDNMKITKDMVMKSDFAKEEEIPDDQIMDLLAFIEKYQSGEKINIYNEMPQFMRMTVDKLYLDGRGQISRNEICKIIADQMISDIKMDQAFMDLNEAIKNELKIPTLSDLYTEFVKENFEEKLLEIADQVEEENPEKAKMLRGVSDTYKTTYTFEVLREALNNRKVRQAIKDPSKFKKVCKKFNDKYINSRFKISSVDMCYGAIHSAIPEMTDEYIKKFIMLFCKTCENMNPDDINDHVFMYYTIQNIRLLQHEESIISGGEEVRSEMYNIVVENIKDTITDIMDHEVKSPRK